MQSVTKDGVTKYQGNQLPDPITNRDNMKIICLTLLFWLTVHPSSPLAFDTAYLHGLGDTRYHYVESEHVGRNYHVYVMLPSGYDKTANRQYPTIYLLDGGALFPMMASYYRYLNFGEEIPDAIIVGISYGSDNFEGGNYRSTDFTAPSSERDYWGGAERFQSFLSDELFKLVENTYASDATQRIIFGQSIGGQFVLYSALTRPELFWGRIASNPALHRNLPFFLETHFKEGMKPADSRLFVANGTLNDKRFQVPAERWVEHWSAMKARPWVLKTIDLEGHSHMSTPPAAFRQGLTWLFDSNRQHDVSAVLSAEGVDPESSTLLIVRLQDGKKWTSGAQRIDTRYPPASTSKIPHTLIALETGYAKGPERSFKWDGVKRFFDPWNKDQTLATAYAYSAVWVYQQITRDLGHETMSEWIGRLDYGNRNIGSTRDLTTYWLNGPLEISAREQVEFVSRLVSNDLPLKPETLHVGKQIMLADKGEDWALYAKTGWRSDGVNVDIGWYVGWLQKQEAGGQQTYVFAFNLDMPDAPDRKKRKAVVWSAFKKLGVLPE